METAIVGILGLIVWVESMAILELYAEQKRLRRLENIVNDLADIIRYMQQQRKPGPLRILDGGARK